MFESMNQCIYQASPNFVMVSSFEFRCPDRCVMDAYGKCGSARGSCHSWLTWKWEICLKKKKVINSSSASSFRFAINSIECYFFISIQTVSDWNEDIACDLFMKQQEHRMYTRSIIQNGCIWNGADMHFINHSITIWIFKLSCFQLPCTFKWWWILERFLRIKVAIYDNVLQAMANIHDELRCSYGCICVANCTNVFQRCHEEVGNFRELNDCFRINSSKSVAIFIFVSSFHSRSQLEATRIYQIYL